MREIYRKIAKQNGVSVAEVKRDMQAAIAYAYQKDNPTTRERLVQQRIPRSGDVPTVEAFVCFAAEDVK